MKSFLILTIFINFIFGSYINNFNHKIFIKKIDDYYLTENNHKLKLSNQVIVKTTLSKSKLQKLYKDIKIQMIAKLKNSSLFLLHLKNKDSIEFAKEIIKDKNIIYAQPDMLQINEKSNKNTNLSFDFNLTKLHKYSQGEGVNIAIIDDGFNLNHKDLKDINLTFSYDVDNQTLNSSPKIEIDTHGTRVAGVIFKIAPKANLIAIRQTSTWTSENILAFYVAKLAGADIINCSWTLPILLEPIKDVIDSLDSINIFAAGNNSCELNKCNQIATLNNVLSIGAINKKNQLMKYSNYGKELNFITYTNFLAPFRNGYRNFGGTSAASAFTSGVIALILATNPNFTKEKVLNILNKTSTKLNNYKKLEPLKAIELAKEYK